MKTVAGSTMSFEVDGAHSIGGLKTCIAESQQGSTEGLSVLFAGQVLTDDVTLAGAGVTRSDYVVAVWASEQKDKKRKKKKKKKEGSSSGGSSSRSGRPDQGSEGAGAAKRRKTAAPIVIDDDEDDELYSGYGRDSIEEAQKEQVGTQAIATTA